VCVCPYYGGMANCELWGQHAGAPTCLDVFGVFDGHGGKQIANYASKNLMPALLKELSKGAREEARGIDIHSKHAHASATTEGVAAMLRAVPSCQ
jgi:serine/threonine protein phosphatase PrpC